MKTRKARPCLIKYPDLSQNLSKQNQNKVKIKLELSYFLKIRMD